MRACLVVSILVGFFAATAGATDWKHAWGEWYVDVDWDKSSSSVKKTRMTNHKGEEYGLTVDCDREVVISGKTYARSDGEPWSAIVDVICKPSWKFWD